MREPPSRDTILVVDDSPETLGFLTEALEATGAMVLVAVSGQEALDIASRITPDVVLLDAVMPGIDGFDTCRRMKASTATAHVPIIFMTGLTETEDIVRGLAAGGVDYVTKPIIIDELLARIRVHLTNARRELSARLALDSAGRYLMAVDRTGHILWATPQAVRLLQEVMPDVGAGQALPEPARSSVAAGHLSGAIVLGEVGSRRLALSALGRAGDDEFLFRLMSDDVGGEEAVLRRRFAVTSREAEVLVWIARGKSNKDIGDILGMSPRTVNKHLETVFSKLGVENRASAAVLALKAINETAG
ncbi:MAG: response regulator transcription factor [Ancalomicrobiaceae bacterium]|nr:response regulator transcription factor [Ancalomicrobiaceae bacterium]